jgi:hypothetical protein
MRGEAEGEGFEPSSDETARNGFRDRRIRPLCHPSAGALRPGQGIRCATPLVGSNDEAEKEGFEPSRQGFSPPNALAGRRLQPLGHFSGSSAG